LVAGGCGGVRCIAMHDHEYPDEIGDDMSRSHLREMPQHHHGHP
jgi:hypothetical protein